MEKYTFSIAKGTGDIRHNNRDFRPKNADPSRKEKNITLVKEDVREAYHKLFDRAVSDYNSRQNRNDRKIKNYYDKIYRSKKEKPFYELIIQVGNTDERPSDATCKKILQDFNKMMKREYQNLHIFNSVIHMDESTPHIHIDFIPIGVQYKKGMDKRVSFNKALKDLGYSNFMDFQSDLFFKLEKIAKKYDIERKRDVAVGAKHIPIQQYREIQRLAEAKIDNIDNMSVRRSSSAFMKKMHAVPEEMYQEIVKDNAYRRERDSALNKENEILRKQLIDIKTNTNTDIYEATIEMQKSEIQKLAKRVEETEKDLQNSQKRNNTLVKQINDSKSTIFDLEGLVLSFGGTDGLNIEAIKQENANLKKASNELHSRLKETEKEAQSVQNSNVNLTKQVESLQKASESQKNEIQRLKLNNRKLTSTIDEITHQTGDISQIKADNERLRAENKRLSENQQKERHTSNERIKKLETENSKQDEDLKTLKKSDEEIRKQNSQYKAENDVLRAKTQKQARIYQMFRKMMKELENAPVARFPRFRKRATQVVECMSEEECAELEAEWAREDEIELMRMRSRGRSM